MKKHCAYTKALFAGLLVSGTVVSSASFASELLESTQVVSQQASPTETNATRQYLITREATATPELLASECQKGYTSCASGYSSSAVLPSVNDASNVASPFDAFSEMA